MCASVKIFHEDLLLKRRFTTTPVAFVVIAYCINPLTLKKKMPQNALVLQNRLFRLSWPCTIYIFSYKLIRIERNDPENQNANELFLLMMTIYKLQLRHKKNRHVTSKYPLVHP